MNQKIVVLATGGTIASKRNRETQKLSSGVMAGDDLVALIPDLDQDLPVEVRNIFGLPSSFLGPDRMMTLAVKVQETLNDPGVGGVVVTHGTDTMEETAFLCDLVVRSGKPVVFTGSQRGPLEPGSDGATNLRDAIRVAAWDASRDKGVLLVFNEEIHSAARAVKEDAHKLEAFGSPGGPVGFVDDRLVRYHAVPVRQAHFPISEITARVDLIKAYAGMDGSLIEACVNSGANGIVIEGFGRGHIPPEAVPAVETAVEAGVVVLVTSRCPKGFIREVYDFKGGTRDLIKAGAVPGTGLPGTKARIKLLVVLSHTGDIRKIRSCFDISN